MNFSQLLEQSGLSQQANLFNQDPTKIAQSLGFTGNQAAQFGQFFTPFNQKQILEASEEIARKEAERTGFLQSDFQSGFKGLGVSLGQTTKQIGQAAGQAGFAGSGAIQKQIGESRRTANESLADIMQRRQQGLIGIQEQAGQERANLTSLMSNYLENVYAQARRIQQLDPTGGQATNPNQSGYVPTYQTTDEFGQGGTQTGNTYTGF